MILHQVYNDHLIASPMKALSEIQDMQNALNRSPGYFEMYDWNYILNKIANKQKTSRKSLSQTDSPTYFNVKIIFNNNNWTVKMILTLTFVDESIRWTI